MDWDDAANEYYKRTFAEDGRLSALLVVWQRELVALMLVNREVGNGGYLQFFVNHGREAYLYASRALKAIGAATMADIVDRCQALIDEHFEDDGNSGEPHQLLPNPIIGRDGSMLKEAGSVLPDDVVSRLSELSYEFMDYPDSVADLAETHFRQMIESNLGN